ncbi:unnamed protein product [Camellia sinensis]
MWFILIHYQKHKSTDYGKTLITFHSKMGKEHSSHQEQFLRGCGRKTCVVS